MNEVKILLKYTKYVLPALTFLSLCKLVLFYWLLKINISEYISIDEILTPFISDALKYLFFFFIPIIIITTLFGESLGQQNVEKYIQNKTLTRISRFLKNLKRNWFLWVCYGLTTLFLILRKQPLEYILSTIASVPLFMIIIGIREELMMKNNFEITKETSALVNISTWLILMFVMTISGAFFKAYQVKKGTTPIVHIQMDNSLIICTDSISYVGRTKHFTFIYNRNAKSTTAIENSEIKKIMTE